MKIVLHFTLEENEGPERSMLREIRFYPPKGKVKSPTSNRHSSLKGRVESGSRDMWALSAVKIKHWESMRSPGQ